MINVTLRQLEVFVDAAVTLSFARVAERRRLTPSAVSFQVRQVETVTGLALFERIGRDDAAARVRLTIYRVRNGIRSPFDVIWETIW